MYWLPWDWSETRDRQRPRLGVPRSRASQESAHLGIPHEGAFSALKHDRERVVAVERRNCGISNRYQTRGSAWGRMATKCGRNQDDSSRPTQPTGGSSRCVRGATKLSQLPARLPGPRRARCQKRHETLDGPAPPLRVSFPRPSLAGGAESGTHLCALYSSSSEIASCEETLISSG